ADFWYRSYRIGNSPIFFGRSKRHRWDSPDGDFGVLYLGGDEYCAFMESIGRGALKTRFVPNAQLKGNGLAKIRFKRTLRLIDMVTSGGLTRVGAESSLTSGSGYKNSQRWSRDQALARWSPHHERAAGSSCGFDREFRARNHKKAERAV